MSRKAKTQMSTTQSGYSLYREIAAYEAMQDRLEDDHFGKWVVFRNTELIGSYDSYEDAAADAHHKFGDGPCLIRLVGQGSASIPTIWASPGLNRATNTQHAEHIVPNGNLGSDPYDYPNSLQNQIKAYDEMRQELEAKFLRKWAVFHNSEFKGAFDSLEDADSFARRSFNRSPCFMWRIGLPFNQSSGVVTHHRENANR